MYNIKMVSQAHLPPESNLTSKRLLIYYSRD
uniref:Uncharacterized protein n=1 Tax=Phage sp. ctL4h4 TaxID=2828005 RepID=A0A8S5TFY2_9VIRU|nr:MAG TPA: hypothetical protein [Phage sp. ctL4h4]